LSSTFAALAAIAWATTLHAAVAAIALFALGAALFVVAACGTAMGMALAAMCSALMRGTVAVGLAVVLLASGTEVRG
jgi:hypothetical protein